MTTFSFTIPLYVISKASVRKRTRYILEQFAFVCVQAFTTRCQVCRGTAPPCPYKSRSYPYEIRYKTSTACGGTTQQEPTTIWKLCLTVLSMVFVQKSSTSH